MNLSRRRVLASTTAFAGAAVLESRAFSSRTLGDAVHVRDFGARGDGATNDTQAIFAASQHVQRQGGGTLVFDRKIYLIGRQHRGGGAGKWAFEPEPVVQIVNCVKKVRIIGNGATLRCAPGLRFGSFNPRSGEPTKNKLPFYDPSEIASPYRAAIWLVGNQGGIEVSGFELDGRINDAVLGGRWGDAGWQINHCGLWIYNNRGEHLIRNIYSHHHGQDAMLLFAEIPNESSPPVPMLVEDFRGEYNGRQGISLTGGRGVRLVRCKLNHTGKNGVISSNPGAGLDIEAEMSLIRDVTVIDSEFDNNFGQGVVADTGNSARINFQRCRFVGATNYAAWPNKPGIRFSNCEFVGGVMRCFEDPAGTEKATQFIDCVFHDDPSIGPTRQVYGTRVDLGGSGGGTLFLRCTFRYTRQMQLPYTPQTVRYRDCLLSQVSPQEAYPTGIYSGTNVIRGNVRLGSSTYRGRLTVNGQLVSAG